MADYEFVVNQAMIDVLINIYIIRMFLFYFIKMLTYEISSSKQQEKP